MTVLAMDDMREIVERVLRTRFPKVQVFAVNLREIEDEDDDREGVEVQIIFEAKKGDFDPEMIPAFLDEVMEAWNEAEEFKFPIVSFIAKSDLGKKKTATA